MQAAWKVARITSTGSTMGQRRLFTVGLASGRPVALPTCQHLTVTAARWRRCRRWTAPVLSASVSATVLGTRSCTWWLHLINTMTTGLDSTPARMSVRRQRCLTRDGNSVESGPCSLLHPPEQTWHVLHNETRLSAHTANSHSLSEVCYHSSARLKLRSFCASSCACTAVSRRHMLPTVHR